MKKITFVPLLLAFSFILGIHEGRIALWKPGQSAPARVFPYSAALLPRDARDALEKGITIDSIEQLEELAENYLS